MIILASVLIGIITVIPEEVRAQTKESLPSSDTLIESTKDYSAEEIIKTPQINPEYLKELTLAYPSSPQNLKSSPGDGYVVLSWAAPYSDGSSAITDYRIYRGTSYGKEVLLDSVTAPRTLYKDTAVKNGQTYYYKVSAVNKEEEEGTSASTKATPTSIVTAPSAPRNIIANAGDRVVNLNWHAPVDNGGSAITEYHIYRGTSSDAESYLCTVSAPTTSYTDKRVTNDLIYYYKVSAENSVGEGEKSNEVDASPKSSLTETTAPLVTTPSAPLNFKASAGDGNVNLEWAEPSDEGGSPITNYNIYRGTTPGGETRLKTVSNVLSYTDDIVINNQTYYYKVSAENSVGEGAKSNEVDARPKSSLTQTTAPLVTIPSAPLNFKASAGDGNVNLEWTEPSDDGGSLITNYNIYRGTTSGGETRLKTVSNVLSYTDDDVINNQTYYYQVSAENSAGEGEMSDEKFATLIPGITVPSAPQDLEATPNDGYVSLEWFPPRDDGGSTISNYNLYGGTAQRGEIFLRPVGNVLTYTDDDVINDQRYYYQVSAENSVGEGERSNEVSVEPKGDTLDMGVWITIIVALIGALGVIAAALINYLSSKKTK